MEALMLQKVITCEVKEVAPRVLEFIGSTETKDRQGDIVRANGWNLKNYKKNPIFMWAHDYSQPPIGKAVKVWVKDNQLMFHIEFADKDTYEFADTIYRLYKGGFLKATSVGFSPLNWEGKSGEDDMPRWGGNVFTEQELLELSGCPVPANPDALLSAKQKRIINAKEYKTVKSFLDDIKDAPVIDNTGDEPVVIEPTPEPIIEPTKREYSQAEIADEIAYLFEMIDSAGLAAENKTLLESQLDKHNLHITEKAELEKGKSGSDIPVEDKEEIPSVESLTDRDFEQIGTVISQTVNQVIKNRIGENKC